MTVGLFVAAAAAVEMVAANQRTINPASGAVLVAVWLAAGLLCGLALWLLRLSTAPPVGT